MCAELMRIYLEWVEPAANVRRFYYAFVGPTFCGPVCVVRIHGRLGGWRRVLPPLSFNNEEEAAKWLERQRLRKLRKGYVDTLATVIVQNSQ
jgi:predicted DNA-binding WGR domain protein